MYDAFKFNNSMYIGGKNTLNKIIEENELYKVILVANTKNIINKI